MRPLLPLGFFLLMFLISPLSAQESAIAMNNAQQGLADTSWPKKPGNQISPLSGKMKDVKQIDQKELPMVKNLRAIDFMKIAGNQVWLRFRRGRDLHPPWQIKNHP